MLASSFISFISHTDFFSSFFFAKKDTEACRINKSNPHRERESEPEFQKMDRYSARGSITRGMIPILAIHVASEFHRLRRKPPVTAGLILANSLIYLRPGDLNRLLPSIDEVWFNPHLIVKYGDLKRFFLSAFYHMGESHLVYNMMSLLWKGIQLETSMGSTEFAFMTASLLGLSQGITLLLAKGLLLFFGYETAYYNQYAVGFSGVLFAMKVVLNSESDGLTDLNGLLVPARHAAWAELILIQMFVPGVSFLGHLGGILAGLLYLKLRHSYSGPNPLAALIRQTAAILSWPLKFLRSIAVWPSRRVFGRGTVGRGGYHAVWRCTTCTYDNSALASACEMCGMERSSGGGSTPSDSSGGELILEEVRRRRLARFSSSSR